MTGTINTRKPEFVTISSEEQAYDLLVDRYSNFDPEEDINDKQSAQYVHDALLRCLHENSTKTETIGTIYEREWYNKMMSVISNTWDI